MQWKHCLNTSMTSGSGCQLFCLVWMVSIMVQAVASYDKIFMGHASIKPGYNFVCHQRTIFNTLGGQIDSRKEYYESDLIHCSIVITSPPGTLIDFRFTEINIISSNLRCEDASLRIYDGSPDRSSNGTSLLLGFPNGICGQAVPSFTIRSTTNSMYLQLMVTSPYTSTFSAIYTAFSPRTSILCFYCGDLCLQAKEQLCDGLNNCRDGEDEKLHECTIKATVPGQPPGPPTRNQYDEDVKLILVFVFACTSFIFLFIIIALLLKSGLCRSCLEKRRQRRAAEAADMILRPYAHRTASGNSIPPVSLGPNRPFLAGPTVPTLSRPGASTGRLAPRSDMPPPYSAVAPESQIRVQQEVDESQTTIAGSTDVQRNDIQGSHHGLNGVTIVSDTSTVTNSPVVVENQPRNTAREEETSFIDNHTSSETVNLPRRSEGTLSQEIQQILDPSNTVTGTLDNPVHTQQSIKPPNCESSTQTAAGISNLEDSSTDGQSNNENDTDTSAQTTTTSTSLIALVPECRPGQTNNERQTDIQSPDTSPSNHSVQSLAPINTGKLEQSDHLLNDINCPTKSTNHSMLPENAVSTGTDEDARYTGNPEQSAHSLSANARKMSPLEETALSLPDDKGNFDVKALNLEVGSDPFENTTDESLPQAANEIDNTLVEVSTRDMIQSIDVNMESDD